MGKAKKEVDVNLPDYPQPATRAGAAVAIVFINGFFYSKLYQKPGGGESVIFSGIFPNRIVHK